MAISNGIKDNTEQPGINSDDTADTSMLTTLQENQGRVSVNNRGCQQVYLYIYLYIYNTYIYTE